MEIIKEANALFWTNKYYAVLFALSLIYITIEGIREGKGSRAFLPLGLYSIILLLFLIENPLFYGFTSFLYEKGNSEYVRMFFIMPFFQSMGYFLLDFFYRKKKAPINKFFLLVVLWILIGGAGESLYENGMCVRAENKFKISDDAVAIADLILGDTNGKGAKVIVDTQGLAIENAYDNRDNNIVIQLIQYTSKIDFVGILVDESYYSDPVWWTGAKDYIKMLALNEDTTEYSYIIMRTDNPAATDFIEEGSLSVVYHSPSYVVLKR